jgi:hypothetical protein
LRHSRRGKIADRLQNTKYTGHAGENINISI